MAVSVLYEAVDGLGIITLNDPSDGNRLNQERIAAIRSCIDQAQADETVRLVLLRSVAPGQAWCLGMDLDMLAGNLGEASAASRRSAVLAYNDLLEAIARGSKPVLACIGGPVKAGGVGLAAACDLVLCTEAASFELTEVLFGLIPANVMPWLLGRRMSLQKIRYLVMSAHLVESAEALLDGLADESYPVAEAEKGIRKLLKTMLRAEPGALGHMKSFSEALYGSPEPRKLAEEKLLELMERPQTAHALQAFGQGGTPEWFGRVRTKQNLFFQEYPLE